MANNRMVDGFIVTDDREDFKFKLLSGQEVGTKAVTKEAAVKHITLCLQLTEQELQEAA
jgi:hypothetical protein